MVTEKSCKPATRMRKLIFCCIIIFSIKFSISFNFIVNCSTTAFLEVFFFFFSKQYILWLVLSFILYVVNPGVESDQFCNIRPEEMHKLSKALNFLLVGTREDKIVKLLLVSERMIKIADA